MLSRLLINKDETLLYMIEFFIYQLNINLDVVENVQPDCLSVHIKFLNFPVLIINKNEFVSSTADTKNIPGIFTFNTGKSLLFCKQPKEFFDLMKNHPVKLVVIEWIPDQNIYFNESDNDDSVIGETNIHLSEYLCDQTLIKKNEQPFNLYKLRNIFQLSNKNNVSSGIIDVFIRITCFGEYLMTQFHTNNDKFVFKNSDSTTAFECLKLMNEKEKMQEEYKKKLCIPDNYSKRENRDLKSKIIQGLSLICQDPIKKLEGESSLPKNVTYKRIEKENHSVDDKNRKLFENVKKLENSLKLFSLDFHYEHHRLSSEVITTPFMNEKWSNSQNKIHERMRGGGVNEEFEKFLVLPVSSAETFIQSFCKSKYEGDLPGCGCYGKSEEKTMKCGLGCINTPCTGIDCLMRKLKETQEFVDSLGKVPGMQGLGLMDPAESPYFNRNRPNLYSTCTEKQFSLSNEQKQSDLVMKIPKKFQDHEKMYDLPNYQEFVGKSNKKSSSMPIKKLRKDEKVEKKDDESVPIKINEVKYGPCGKVTCKSRKANSENDFSQYPEPSSSQKLSLKSIKKTKSQRSKFRSSRKHSKKIIKSQSLDLKPNYVQISRKIMKLVDSTRPRFCYGHKSCVDVRMRVPGNMGWLWNTRETLGKLKPQVGWKPGAISRHVWNLLEDAKVERTSEDIRDRPLTPVRGKRAKSTKRKHLFFPSRHYWGHRARDNEYQLPPTLHIHRKKGDYFVTFYPINRDLINKPEEQQTIKPLHFHIRKNKNPDFSGESSSTASDMEIEFSPPAATTRYQKKVDTRDVDTLVYQNDIIESVKEILPEVQPKKKKKKKKSK